MRDEIIQFRTDGRVDYFVRRPEQMIQQKITLYLVAVAPAAEQQMAIQTQLGARRDRLPAIVGLHSRAPHEHVCPLSEGVGQQEFIVSRLVAAERQPGAIIPFDEDGWSTKRLGKTRQRLQWRWQVG